MTIKYAFAGMAMLGLTGCVSSNFTPAETGALTGVGAGVAANALGASDTGVAVAVVTGAILGNVLSRAQDAGCRYSSGPVRGALNFQNVNDGIYLVCPPSLARPGNPVIESLRQSGEWSLVQTPSQQARYNNGLIIRNGFR